MKTSGAPITEKKMLDLLATRHDKDIFVGQCKDGPTQHRDRGDLLILDAWAMPRSWSKLKYVGYEVKVSRPDFLRDDKWRRALSLCNEFYWVAPPNVIDVTEVSDECGLLVSSKNGTRLYTKKRAPFRPIAPPMGLIHYVLICRSSIRAGGEFDNGVDNTAKWRAWLNQKEEKRDLGYEVSRAIRERVNSVQARNAELEKAISKFSEMCAELVSLGLAEKVDGGGYRPTYYRPYGSISESMREGIMRTFPWGIEGELKRAIDVISKLRENAKRQLDLCDDKAGSTKGEPCTG